MQDARRVAIREANGDHRVPIAKLAAATSCRKVHKNKARRLLKPENRKVKGFAETERESIGIFSDLQKTFESKLSDI